MKKLKKLITLDGGAVRRLYDGKPGKLVSKTTLSDDEVNTVNAVLAKLGIGEQNKSSSITPDKKIKVKKSA